MLELAPLSDYRFLYELEPNPSNVSFDVWKAQITQPQWLVYGVQKDSKEIGALIIERLADDVCEYHYSIVRKSATPRESRRLLIEVGKLLFAQGFNELRATIPATNRAACRLAVACGFTFQTFVVRHHLPHLTYALLRSDYLAQPSYWD